MSYGNYELQVMERTDYPQLKSALNDDPYGAGIIVPHNEDALVGSRLFNLATSALGILRKTPEAKLLKEPIKLDEDQKKDVLLRHTNNILNIGHVALKAAYAFRSPPAPNAGICANSELNFWDALTCVDDDPDLIPSTLLVNNEGKVVLAYKEIGQPTALSFKSLLVNGVRVPAGTIFSFQANPSALCSKSDNFSIMRAEQDSINYIAPIRFSAYAFDEKTRKQAFTPIDNFDIPGQSALTSGRPTYADLHNRLPDAKVLKQAYGDCSKSS